MAMLYLRNKPIGAISSGASGGGHTIENPSGTDMTQRSNLQFTDADVADDSTNDRTEISVVRELTQAEFDELTPEEQNRGVIVIKDANPIYVPSNNAVSVTADGVKTYGQLFSELYALADATKVTRNAKLVMTNTSGDVIYNIERNYGTGITFVKTRNVVNDYLVETIWLGTTSAYYLAATEASSTTFTNSTNSVPASGVRFALYYNIVCTDNTGLSEKQTITLNSGFSAVALYGGCFYRKRNTTVEVNLSFGGALNADWVTIGTLPSGYRPTFRAVGSAVGFNGSGIAIAMFYVQPDGQIVIKSTYDWFYGRLYFETV